MPRYDPRGCIVFSPAEKEELLASARQAGITVEQQIKLLLVRGLPAVTEDGRECVLGVDLSRLAPSDTP